MKTEFTPLEQQAIDSLIEHLFAEPGFSDVSTADLAKASGIAIKSLRGVLSSLAQKGVVAISADAGVSIVYLESRFYHLHPVWGKNVRSLANCHITAALALGHSKAENNERRAEEFRAILESEGIPIPTNAELCDIGVFNGDGAY
jgi:DNA replication protein DnaD